MIWKRGADNSAAPLSERSRHRSIVLVAAGGMLLLGTITDILDLASRPMVAAGLIIVFGLPHGALDVLVAGSHHDFSKRAKLLGFLIQYTTAALLVAVLWWLLPIVALVGFLAISAAHFGGDWDDVVGTVGQAIVGIAILAATTLFYQEEVAVIFGWLVPRATANVVSQGLYLIALLTLPLSAFILSRQLLREPLGALEAAAMIVCAVIMSPITFFVFYFCLLHSVRHLCVTRSALSRHNPQCHLSEAAPYALLAALTCLAGSMAFLQLGPGPALLSSVFVVLSALTVPHMLLVEWARPRPSDV